jgi:hypothetical protein
MTRNTIALGERAFDRLATPTPTQQRAFDLLDAPVSLTIT